MSNKFVAKTTKNVPVVANGKSIISSADLFKQIKTVAPTIPTINLSSINAAQLKNTLQQLLNDKSLTTNTFIFTSNRYSRKLELERNRVETVLGIIDRVITLNRNIINYNVDVFLTQQRLEELALKHAVDMEKYARAILREEELLARLHTDNLDKVDDEYRLRKAALDKVELENERMRLENARIKAHTDEAVAKITFIKEVLGQVNVKNMPSTMQAYITATIINPNGSQFNDFDMQEQLKEYVKREAEARADGLKAETKSKEYKAEHEKWKHERERNRPRE